MKNLKKFPAILMAICIASMFSACSSSSEDSEETPINSDNTESVTYTTADVQSMLDDASDTESAETTTVPEDSTEQVTYSTVTDVENEVDRAIYKTSLTLPDGWQITEDSNQGKIYASDNAHLKIQATNYGADAELTDLDTFADSVAASIKYTNMYLKADTDYSDPVHETVAGDDAVRYDYTVTAYFFETDSEGNSTGEKQVYAYYPGRIYVFYHGTDAYILQFETEEKYLDDANKDFDAIIESFNILDDGTEGYESASAFMSEYKAESISESILYSELDEIAAEQTAEETASESE